MMGEGWREAGGKKTVPHSAAFSPISSLRLKTNGRPWLHAVKGKWRLLHFSIASKMHVRCTTTEIQRPPCTNAAG